LFHYKTSFVYFILIPCNICFVLTCTFYGFFLISIYCQFLLFALIKIHFIRFILGLFFKLFYLFLFKSNFVNDSRSPIYDVPLNWQWHYLDTNLQIWNRHKISICYLGPGWYSKYHSFKFNIFLLNSIIYGMNTDDINHNITITVITIRGLHYPNKPSKICICKVLFLNICILNDIPTQLGSYGR
jgi:hypothetical protein